MSDHAEVNGVHHLGLLRWLNGSIDLALLYDWWSEPGDILLERVVTLGELSNCHGIVHTDSAIPLELIDDFLLEEPYILGLDLISKTL